MEPGSGGAVDEDCMYHQVMGERGDVKVPSSAEVGDGAVMYVYELGGYGDL